MPTMALFNSNSQRFLPLMALFLEMLLQRCRCDCRVTLSNSCGSEDTLVIGFLGKFGCSPQQERSGPALKPATKFWVLERRALITGDGQLLPPSLCRAVSSSQQQALPRKQWGCRGSDVKGSQIKRQLFIIKQHGRKEARREGEESERWELRCLGTICSGALALHSSIRWPSSPTALLIDGPCSHPSEVPGAHWPLAVRGELHKGNCTRLLSLKRQRTLLHYY